jgi:HK97 family phage portal protein
MRRHAYTRHVGIWNQARQAWQKLRASWSISDPKMIELFNLGPQNYAGTNVTEYSALALSAVYRAVALISSTVASLPLRTQREVDGTRTRVSSFLDNPGGLYGPTKYEWTETIMLHGLLHGNIYLLHVYNGAGSIVALVPVHPLAVTPDWETDTKGRRTGRKVFDVNLDDGTRPRFTQDQMTHIPALSLDGLQGVSPIWVARNSLGTAIAGDNAAAKLFASGPLYGGIATPDGDMEEEDAKVVHKSLNANAGGWMNAGEIAFINQKIKFQPWSMSLEDAQFLQSRQFQIEEISRWFGVPPHLLSQTEKQTSWGTGVAEQNRGLARYTLTAWTSRIEQRLSRLLPAPRFVEFDYAGLLKPAPEQEIPLLIQQVQAGLMTVNEARRIRGMDPIEGGDELAGPQQVSRETEQEAVPA